MLHVDLFSGIGGFALAARRSFPDHVVGAFVEIDPYCRKILRRHWPTAPIWDDVRTFNPSDHVRPGSTVDLLTAGPPCQPYSVAGTRQGDGDDRALWPEVIRVIRETRPRWVVVENVVGFLSLGYDPFAFEMEKEGYEVGAAVLCANAVGAYHERRRVFIVANSNGTRREEQRGGVTTPTKQSSLERLSWGGIEPELARLVSGVPGRVDRFGRPAFVGLIPDRVARIRALGNAVYPKVVEVLFGLIADVDDQT